ncbi:hypothetical protein MRBLWO14_001165 [Microbacterium sp. LWO14-1.2]|uniref:hypothetical protein n=1 Tax=Microbacterium sp. LWO14-1.2 TaxID=3135263 RepID=UPI0031395638
MALTIDIAANSRAAQRDVKDLSKALDDTADALEDITRDGDKAGDKLEASFRDMVRSAGRADDAVRKIGDGAKQSFDKASDGAEEFADEANSTAREAAASFDGSAESIADALQEIAANAFAGFGPAGAVAGLAAAAGIGLAVAGFENVQEAQEELQALTNEWANTYLEEGSKVLSTATIVAKGLEILSNQHAEVTENARLWGVAEETAVAAMAGSPAALDEVAAALDRKRDAAAKDAQAAQELAQANGGTVGSLTPLEVEVNKATDAFNRHVQAQRDGATAVDTMSYFLRDQATAAKDATLTVDEFGDSIYTLPDGKQIYIDAETGQATENVSAIESKIYGIPDGNATVYVNGDTSDVDRKLRILSGTTIKIGARIVTSGNGWDQ